MFRTSPYFRCKYLDYLFYARLPNKWHQFFLSVKLSTSRHLLTMLFYVSVWGKKLFFVQHITSNECGRSKVGRPSGFPGFFRFLNIFYMMNYVSITFFYWSPRRSIVFSTFYSTVKPLYPEHHQDFSKAFTIRRCSLVEVLLYHFSYATH